MPASAPHLPQIPVVRILDSPYKGCMPCKGCNSGNDYIVRGWGYTRAHRSVKYSPDRYGNTMAM